MPSQVLPVLGARGGHASRARQTQVGPTQAQVKPSEGYAQAEPWSQAVPAAGGIGRHVSLQNQTPPAHTQRPPLPSERASPSLAVASPAHSVPRTGRVPPWPPISSGWPPVSLRAAALVVPPDDELTGAALRIPPLHAPTSTPTPANTTGRLIERMTSRFCHPSGAGESPQQSCTRYAQCGAALTTGARLGLTVLARDDMQTVLLVGESWELCCAEPRSELAVTVARGSSEARALGESFDVGVFDLDLADSSAVELAEELLSAARIGRAVFFTGASWQPVLRRAARMGAVVEKEQGPAALWAELGRERLAAPDG